MRRTASILGGVAGCVIVGLPGVAAAAPESPKSVPFHDSDTFTDENFCGTGADVEITFDVRGRDFLSPKKAAFAAVVQGKETFTFEGQTVTNHFAGRFVDRIVEGEEGGAHVHEFTHTGIPLNFRADGKTILKDVGRVTFRVAFDEEDNVISDSIAFLAGPHPVAEAENDLFCEALIEALGIPTEE